jgi:5-methylcytosine-specific restriction enzyme B
MSTDLSTDDGLRTASNAAFVSQQKQCEEWRPNLAEHLARVKSASESEFLSREFQRDLWENEAISATGMGTVDVSNVIGRPEIARRLLDFRNITLPDGDEERNRIVVEAWEDLEALVSPFVDRTPRLKMQRVLASLQPAQFTTVAHFGKLSQLARAMGVSRGVHHKILLHDRVLRRLREVLDHETPASNDGVSLERMMLPWFLLVTQLQDEGEDATEIAGGIPGYSVLKPLPANRRRRGMLAIGGSMPSILAMIEFAKDGCKREDFREHVRSINPKLASSSIGTQLSALIAEWGVLRAEGDDIRLTSRGEALLESGDPEEVADWLLTRILGFDNVLCMLRDSPRSSKQLGVELQRVNPGWTTTFAPTTLVNWIRTLGLAEQSAQKVWSLTERGEEWARRIHWEPGTLSAPEPPSANIEAITNNDDGRGGGFVRPTLAEIIASFPSNVNFKTSIIGRLDAGLWSHERRHFAVLTGLSGAGKTMLAMLYAKGLWRGGEEAQTGLHILTVQPGWHDPSNVLGYVNPLSSESYVRTGFLEFLLRATGNPDRPYVVILDEMNLSHPEQYLAPLLSAMETGSYIELHAEEEEISGVPPRIPYPSNLLLIGTVNMDETTHGLSDKVLDRATVIEFWDIDVDDYPGWKTSHLQLNELQQIRATVNGLVMALRPVRLHFGWRTIGDILGYVSAAKAGNVIDFITSLDDAVYSKVLPKLRGEHTPRVMSAFNGAREVLARAGLPQSEAKLKELLDDLELLGSARFWR